MKNKKLVGLLALASCVILSGCGTDDKVTTVTLKELPNEIVFGEFDLSEYVTLENANSFEVALAEESQGIASVEGTKITVTGEGDVKFTVTAGGKTAEGSVKAVSQFRKLVAANLAAEADEYVLFDMEEEEISSFTYHCPNYMLSSEFDDESDLGGLVSFPSGNCYMFFVDLLGSGLTIDPQQFPSENFAAYNPSFKIDLSKFAYGKGTYNEEDYEYLRWEEDGNGTVAQYVYDQFAVYFPGYDLTALEIYAYETTSSPLIEIDVLISLPDFMLDPEWDKVTTPDEYEMVEAVGYSTYISTDSEFCAGFKYADIEEAIINEDEPITKAFDEFPAAVEAIIESKNFQIDAEFGWVGLNESYEEIPFAETQFALDAVDDGGLWAQYPEFEVEYYLPYLNVGTSKFVINETQTYEEDEGAYLNVTDKGLSYGVLDKATSFNGYVINNGELYQYGFMPANPAKGIEVDGVYAMDQDLEIESLFGVNFGTETLEDLLDESCWADLFASKRTVDGDKVTIIFNGASAPDVLYSLMYNTVFGSRAINGLAANNRLQFLDVEATIDTVTNEISLHATFDINFDSFGPEYGVMRWFADVDIKNIGEAEIPDLTIDYDTLNQAE